MMPQSCPVQLQSPMSTVSRGAHWIFRVELVELAAVPRVPNAVPVVVDDSRILYQQSVCVDLK